jgi:hypothetical protein
MARRIIVGAFAALRLRSGRRAARDAGVHFHQGPSGLPAVCYDQHCPNPRLSVPGA